MKNKKQKILMGAAILASSFLYQSALAKDASGMNTTTMINNSLQGLSDCSNYCIVGFELRLLIIPPFKYELFATPIIEHNISDLIVMSQDKSEDIAWEDHRNLFGKPLQMIGNKLLMATVGGKVREIGGGQSKHDGFGKDQSLVFKDAEVVGNPVAYYIESMGGQVVDGHFDKHKITTDKNGNAIKPKNRWYNNFEIQQSLDKLLSGMTNNININIDGALYQQVGGFVYRPMVRMHPSTLAHKYQVQAMVSAYAATLINGKVDYYACNSSAQPFKPFFSSRLDGITWREGFPFNDPGHADQILNPMSSDVIRPSKGEGGFSIKELGNAGWGHIYPRSGFINAVDDYKAGAVVSRRAIDLTLNGGTPHITQRVSGNKTFFWQPIYPKTSQSCYKNIADTVVHNNIEGNYAWNGWRRYSCSLSKKGKLIARVRLGNISCLGSSPK